MGSKPFQFKKFSIAQDVCTHKVGTDGVLLGAWVSVSETDVAALDIGTGSGLLAIMLAQRTSPQARIDALDIELRDIQQARQNVQRSPWPEKINVVHTSLQKFYPDKRYDLIVSNPPFFVSSLLPPDAKRTLARHTLGLSFKDLLQNAVRLLSVAGRLAVILPFIGGRHFVNQAQAYDLFPQRQSIFRSRVHKPPERLLVELSRTQEPQRQEEEIVLYGDGDEWSDQYKRLTREFYLKA